MSHFCVIVCIEDPSKLEAVLAPYDENLEVDAYRHFEKGQPAQYWAVRTFREKNGLNPDDSTLTWAQIAEVHNRVWDDEPPMLLDDGGNAYSVSTRNPNGKWDYWRVGGRWGGHFITTTPGDRRIYASKRGWDSPTVIARGTCDGGPRGLLDLDGTRQRAAAEAQERFGKWLVAVDATPEARPWREFADMIGQVEGYSRDQARLEYRSQPRMVALEGTEFGRMWGCPIAEYQMPEALYVERARAGAVPGYALVTLDGKWMAPGDMGWFGCSTDNEGDRIGYLEVANTYIESLPDEVYLIAVDCHV